ncbi:TonB-dependent siderophore receptor [Myxosarcina sp. GI1(2024)]
MALRHLSSEWTMTNSFHAAYLIWDRSKNIATSQLESERYFEYEEFPLEKFYNLVLEANLEFSTGTLKQATTIGIEVNKNPFIISGEGIKSPAFTSSTFTTSILPSPYLASDFVSKKNYIGLFIAHEINFSDRLSFYFEGTFDVAIGDTSDLSQVPTAEPIENHDFYPELGFSYQLTKNTFLFTTLFYANEPIEGTDALNRSLQSEVYTGIELGIETEQNKNWWATLSYYDEAQDNIAASDPNQPDFDLQIDEQTSRFWMGEIRGKITPGWWVYGFYSYTDAKVTEDEVIPVGSSVAGVARHSSGLWTSYEITKGTLQGLGFGGGVTWYGDRPGDTKNSFILPGYLQTDAAIFYSQDNFRAALSIQNLFNAGIEDEEVGVRALFGTVWFQF